MSVLTQAFLKNGFKTFFHLKNLLRWKRNWAKKDLYFTPSVAGNQKFMSAMDAVKLIPHGSTVASSGFAGCGLCNTLFWAIKKSYQTHKTPGDLVWMIAGPQGGRGRVPGTFEELAIKGLLRQYVDGHMETVKAELALAANSQLELHTLPQGTIIRLFALQADGVYEVETSVGVGTFMDPLVGSGTAVTQNASTSYVKRQGDSLVYHLPKIQVALLSVPYADKDGNLYFHDEPLISENREVVNAAVANNGKVIAIAGKIIERDEAKISIPANKVDAITVNPWRIQIAGIPQDVKWNAFLPEQTDNADNYLSIIELLNRLTGVTPKRNKVDQLVAESAAHLFSELVPSDGVANFGVGLPEEVCKTLYRRGLAKNVTFTTEAGAYGGVPTPGMFFGAAIHPERIESSAWMFDLYRKRLNVAVLGFLQVDSQGNVNVSKRGPRIQDFVGPGGFCDIVHAADIVIFVGSWMVGGRYRFSNDRLVISRQGKVKFVEQVDQITFSAEQAKKQNKKVYYVTNTGVFKLSENGLVIHSVTPGIDVQKDIIEGCSAKISST